MKLRHLLVIALLGMVIAHASVSNGLKVSANQRYLVDARTDAPVFLLADTAWNLANPGKLTLEKRPKGKDAVVVLEAAGK